MHHKYRDALLVGTSPIAHRWDDGNRCHLFGGGAGSGASNAMSPAQQAQQQAAAAFQRNLQIRRLLVHGNPAYGIPPAVDMWQPLIVPMPATITPGVLLNVPLRNVGLVKRLILEISGTITAGASSTQTLTKLGLANLISNVTFYDLANNVRINTTGWHLVARSSAQRRKVWGSAVTTDTPFGYGNNYVVNKTAASINANGNTAFRMFLELPFVRTDDDLRGIIFANTTQATMQAQVTFNPNMFVASGIDATSAVYQSAGADLATLSGVTVTAYQNYLDQGPTDQQGNPLVPGQDVGTAYVLTQTVSSLPVANQLNATNFINQRQFLSLVVVYDNAGTLNAGTDITNFQIASANFTQIRNLDPFAVALMGRVKISDDFPPGMYYFDFSDRPIDTVQYGNMQYITQPSSVGGSTAVQLFGWEAYGTIGQINVGGSLPSGGG
jgi:hypothetical protein